LIVISEALALALRITGQANRPILGYDNLLTIDNVAADYELAAYPATNLANPSTAPQQGWRSSSTALQHITVTLATTTAIDYLALARHNLGSAQIPVTIEGLGADDGGVWRVVVEERLLPDDDPALFRFTPEVLIGIRAKMGSGLVAPRAAVGQVGTLLNFPEGVTIGSVQLPFGRNRNIITGKTPKGDFLGRIINGGTRRGSVTIKNIDPDRFRDEVDPFLVASAARPFFWVAEPQKRPNEVGFAWLTSEPQPPTAYAGGAFDLSLELEGIL